MSSKELNTFRKSCRNFLEQEAKPLLSKWENDGFVSRDFWLRMGNAGLLGINVPQQWGGHGKEDYNFSSVLTEELIRSDMVAPVVIAHNDVITSYIYAHGTDKQRERWLPKLCRGELIAAIAITEPNGGSDSSDLETTADKHGDYYIVNGKKSFITNGFNADLILTAVKTSKSQRGRETSLLIIENDTVGFMKEKPLKKLGWHASDTANLHFSNCHVSISNLIGNENMGGFYFIGGMPRERLSISTVAVSTSEIIIEKTLEWVKNRKAFGQPIGSFQHNRFRLAELDTEVKIARIYLNDAIDKFNKNELSVADAARIKVWTTELQIKVADQCMQWYGGKGYLRDSFIGKMWVNSRVQTIYGGTSEVLKEFISKSLGL